MKLLQITLSAFLVAVTYAQQSHPQLQAYLQQQQILQQQPARQQYRLVQQPQVQQYSAQDDDSSPAQYQQLPQVSQQVYRPQPQQQQQISPAALARLRAAQAAQQGQAGSLEQPEDYDPNPQYQFGFDVKDDQFTNYQNRKEQRDGDKISGSYSVVDSDGFIRTVTYTADPKEGFKAEVTRTPTDIVVKLPTPPPQQLTDAAGLQRQLAARQHQYDQSAAQPVQYSRPSYQQQAVAQASPQQLQQLIAAQQQRQQHGGSLLRAAAAQQTGAYQAYQQQ